MLREEKTNGFVYLFTPEDCDTFYRMPRMLKITKAFLWVGVAFLMSVGVSQLV
ncbi:hypothetical protein SYK_23330 [Pseudodesulfovibrio nedwellii]|uniref:Uncharacterized protein n=1 Tax=Pseudodesulfovibrio nedwellii TaxID=2973072 RepID=A0ABN6S6L7_9BACT|nr:MULTISPECIES: hypothetical protein [Pseudodesulfovibrio]BDQ37973.1 hypothetical protein SYK_23330 [Pseudodesulfovibrio nedwellii]